MTMKSFSYFLPVLLAGGLLGSSAATGQQTRKPEPLVIQEQGSFLVGGTVVTAPGTFDPIKQGAFNPAGPDPRGQTLHGDLSSRCLA
jgi:hypothetical protein